MTATATTQELNNSSAATASAEAAPNQQPSRMPQPTDQDNPDIGARFGICLGGAIFAILAIVIVTDILRTVLGR